MTPCVTILWISSKFYQNTTEWCRFRKVSKICIFGFILELSRPRTARQRPGRGGRVVPAGRNHSAHCHWYGGHAQRGLFWRPTGFPWSETRLLAATVTRSHSTWFLFMGCLKGKVYANNPQTITQLEENIRIEIVNIDLPTLGHVYHNFEQRIDHCTDSDGGLVEKTWPIFNTFRT